MSAALRARMREARMHLVAHGVNGVPAADRLLGEILRELEPGPESVEAKAARYLAEGRLVVTRVDGELVEAIVRGEGDVYALAFDGRWSCSCPARTARCAHLEALRLVATATPHHRSEPITGATR